MSSYGYDAQNDELNIISGTPQQLINQALGRATGAITNEGDAFDATRTSANPYLVGDYVIYNNTMYECTTQHYGAWDSSHFTQRNIGDVLTTLNSALTNRITSHNFHTEVMEQTAAYTSITKNIYTATEEINVALSVRFQDHSNYRYYAILVAGNYVFSAGTATSFGGGVEFATLNLLLKEGDTIQILTQTNNASSTNVIWWM